MSLGQSFIKKKSYKEKFGKTRYSLVLWKTYRLYRTFKVVEKTRKKSPRGRFKAVTFHYIIYKMIKNIGKLDRIPFDLLKKCFSDTVIQYISKAEHRLYRIYFADVPQAFNFIKKDSTAGFFLWIMLNF